ncbi:unnamed protein product [Cladocopium goreaui]|uniref:EF-hand domain-containing protein n=1 Tax=Cladocopium goreaui TaxID=2562237 RepID=A0A9P1CGH7_9DINO|nr:unnamed protein product [Cladocopium goreaui]
MLIGFLRELALALTLIGGDILQAAKEGNVGAVRRLLQKDPPSLEQVDKDGDGPLTYAAVHGHLEVVEALLAAGASVEAKNHNGEGPLHLAAANCHLEVVEALLAAGASVDAKSNSGEQPLHLAAWTCNLEAVQALLAAGASVEAKSDKGATPLHWAADNGQAAVVEQLLAAGAAVDAVDNQGRTPLHDAAKWGHTAVVEQLLVAGAAVDAASSDGQGPWKRPVGSGDDRGRTALHWAAGRGRAAVVEQLLAAGAAVDAADNLGRTALHWAAIDGDAAVVERLLAVGAAVDAVDSDGKTPYDCAKQNDHRQVMGVLDPVFVALLSGRSCRCNSAHETVQDLKEEAERKLGTTIEHLIGPDMQPLNGAMTLQEANILPGNTLTAVLDPVVLKDFGHGISMKTAQSVFDEYGPRMEVLADWKDLKDPSSLEEVLHPGHAALSQLVRLSPEDVTFPKPVEVEMPTCVGAKSVWRSSATGWERLLGAKFSDGRVVVALSHFCDVVATGPCGLKAVGFIDPHGANAKVALLHVACESCQNSLEQLCSDADMLGSFKKCGPSVPLGTYRHDEDLELRQGQEAMNMRVRFHRMPQISRKLVAHSASHFSVEIEGDDHQFEELRSEAATSATASNPTASDPPSAPATSQAMPAAAMTSDVSMAQERPERGHLLLSGRFNSDTVINYMKAVKRRLEERRIPVYMVQAQVGQSFAELTRIGLGRAKGMVAFCTSEYGNSTFMAKDGQDTSAGRPRCETSNFGIYAVLTLADHAGVEAIFQHLDPTGSGTLGKEELLSILSGLGVSDQELPGSPCHVGMSADDHNPVQLWADFLSHSDMTCAMFLRNTLKDGKEVEGQWAVLRQDVQTELNISEPNGPGSKVEAEDWRSGGSCFHWDPQGTKFHRVEKYSQGRVGAVGGHILQAAEEGNVGAVRRLLQVDPQSLEQVDEDGGNLRRDIGLKVEQVVIGGGPLAIAARKGHLEVVQVLLAAGASVEAMNKFCFRPLHLAAAKNHPEVVEVLLAAGAWVEAKNDNGATPLHWAAERGHAAVVEQLLAAGAAVDAASSDGRGRTPLHDAAKWGHTAVMEQLLAAGAAVDAASSDGQGPWKRPVPSVRSLGDLHKHQQQIVATIEPARYTILEKMKLRDFTPQIRRTPLHSAALNGHTAVMEQLLAAGAAVDAASSDGATPLHYAALNNHTAVVERLLAAGAAVDAADNNGVTPYDTAKHFGRRKVMGVLDPVFVALLSGRSCKCSSYHETVQELKEEAEKKLGITIQRLIGVNMEPLNEAKTLEEAGVLPGHTLTAVIAPAAGQGDVSEAGRIDVGHNILQGGDLQNPNDFIEFLISANIRLVRAEFLIELDETGTPMPRRQEAEFMHVQSGATALVELSEYKELHVNQTSGWLRHVTIRTAEGPSIVRFRSISHMWEAMEHPDPWGFQVRSIVERYRELPKDSVTWVFVDFMSLYQYKRSAEEDEFFRKGLKRMHWLYSHEIVQVDILTELTPEDKKFEGEILVYNATEDQVKLTPICELRLNNPPYELRGWCQSESEWSRLRMDVLGGCIPTPPEIFRKRMQRMRFTHRNDAEQVLALQEKVFRDKVSKTTHLQLQQLSGDDLECLHDALPHYNRLEYMVVNGNALKGQDAVAMVTSGAADIQMESCSLQDEDADAISEALMSSAADRLEHLSLTGNRFSDIGTAALRKVMEQRPQLKIRLCHTQKPANVAMRDPSLHDVVTAAADDELHENGEKASGREKSSSVCGPNPGWPKFCRADADRIGPCQRHGGFLRDGAYTGAGEETFHELEYAHDNKLHIFPTRLCEEWAPAPQNNPRGTFQNEFVFKNGLVYVDDRQMNNAEGAADQIADSVTSSGIFAN